MSWTLLSNQPGQMLKSSSNAKRYELPPKDRALMSRNPPANVISHCTRLETLWNAGDTFLPDAKHPVAFPNQHHRNCSEQTLVAPLCPTTAARAPKPHFGGWRQPSKARSMTFQSSRQTLDGTPIPDISREQYKMLTEKVQRSLTQANDHVMASSGASDGFTPGWKPPPCWAGPSATMLVGEGKEPKPPTRSKLTNRKRTRSSPRLGVRERMSSIPQRSQTPEPFQLVDIMKSREDMARIWGKRVSVRYYEGWHEKPVGDVLHILRELRLK